MYRSTNNGSNWTAINSGITKAWVESFAASGDVLFAGTYEGIFLSTTSGTSWTAVGTGLPAKPAIRALAVSGGTVFAASAKYGVWRRPLSEMVGVIDTRPPPASPRRAFTFLSSGATASSVTAVFSLPQSENVLFALCTASGQKIATVLNKRYEAGVHTVPLAIRDVAAGCYIMVLQAGPDSFAKRFPILR